MKNDKRRAANKGSRSGDQEPDGLAPKKHNPQSQSPLPTRDQAHDRFFRAFFGEPARFAALLQQFLPSELLSHASTSSPSTSPTTTGVRLCRFSATNLVSGTASAMKTGRGL